MILSLLKKLLLSKNTFYEVVSNGFSEHWFADYNIKYFIKFLRNYHASNSTNPDFYFRESANLYILEDDERSKFLNFVEDVLDSDDNIDFDSSFSLLKQKYLSTKLVKKISPLLDHIKNANYEKAVSTIQRLALETSMLTSQIKNVNDIRDEWVHDKSLEISYGIEVGFPTIDKATKGFKPGQLIILVSGPGEGKSTFLLNIAYNVFMKNKNVLFFSCEMPMYECVRRFDSLHLKIPYTNLETKTLTDEEVKRYVSLKEELKNKQNYFKIVDQSHPTIFDLESEIAQLTVKPDLVIVDYLALVKSVHDHRNKWESMDDVTVGLRTLARKYGFPIVTAAQVNRDAMGTKQEFYKSHHISGSISLLHHCDIMLATRIDDPDSLKAAPVCSLNVIFWKNRNGMCPSFILGVDFSKFYIWEYTEIVV